MSMDEASVFRRNLEESISFYRDVIACETSKQSAKTDNADVVTANVLLDALLRLKCGLVANPALFFDLMTPSKAQMGKEPPLRLLSPNVAGDETQACAVRKALAMHNLLAIQGPPGAGKTTTILEIIAQIKKNRPDAKILLCSQTHVAVDNVFLKILSTAESTYQNLHLDAQIMRVMQNEKTDPAMKPYDITAFFSAMRQNVCGAMASYIQNMDGMPGRNGSTALGNNALIDQYREDVILQKDIIGVTINSLKKCHFSAAAAFDCVIVDEVGKSSFAEIVAAARLAKKLILIGDPNQLPPVSDYEFPNDPQKTKRYKDLFTAEPYINHLFSQINPTCKVFLEKQYRMVPEIGSFISQAFYQGQIKNGRTDSAGDGLNYVDYDVRGHELLRTAPKLQNDYEATIIRKLIDTRYHAAEWKKKIAIIAPYQQQVALLRNTFKDIPAENINTVDAFQGQEKEIVFFSCTRNVPTGPIKEATAFFKTPNRLNVAISRAKNQIWVVGASSYLNLVPSLQLYTSFSAPIGQGQTAHCRKWFFDGSHIVEQ